MRRERIQLWRLLLAVLAVLIAGCGTDATDSGNGTTDAADADTPTEATPDVNETGDGDSADVSGPLVWYTSIPTSASEAIMQEFMALHPGVSGEVVRSPTFELWERFRSEKAADRHLADVLGVADWGIIEEAKAENLIEQWIPTSIEDALEAGVLAEEFVDPDGYYFSNRLTTIAFVYNTHNVPEDKVPTSWMDLADPWWGTEGKIGTGDPREAAGIYEAFWQMDQAGFAEELFRGLAANDPIIYAQGGQQLNALTAGEIDGGIIVDYRPYQMIEVGVPLAVVNPSEGIGSSPDYNALVSNAPNPDAARAFLEWLGSAEGGEATAKAVKAYVVRTDVPPYPEARPPLSEIKVLPGDRAQAVADFESFNARWDEWMNR